MRLKEIQTWLLYRFHKSGTRTQLLKTASPKQISMRKLDCAFERVSGNMVDKTLWSAASLYDKLLHGLLQPCV
jgi:hypothetical protein